MSILSLILLIAFIGAFGGFANCAVKGEFELPHIDDGTKVWKPGWISNIVVGAIAATVVWGLYGPLASFDILNEAPPGVSYTISHLASSLLVGFGGGRICLN